MSDTDLLQRIESLEGKDLSDPSTYAELLGYNNEPEPEPAAQPEAPQAEAAPAAPEQAPATAENSAPAGAVETTQEQEAAGVATKDGKRVIPYAVLQDEREARKAAAARNAELEAQLAKLQEQLNGSQPANQATADAVAEFTDEEIEAAETDFPLLAKLARTMRRQVQVQAAPQAPAAPAIDVQALIDEHPLLAGWQAKGGIAWQSAVTLDQQLKDDPTWGTKPIAERFAEVQRRIADEFGVATPKPAPAAKPPAAKPAPAPEATTINPTLTDFNGSPASVGDPLKGMNIGQMVDATMNMSMEEIRRMAGLSY